MEVLKTKGIAKSGVLSIPVPKELEERELEVIIFSTNDVTSDEQSVLSKHHEKVERLMKIVGAAKFPDLPITKYDVYEQ